MVDESVHPRAPQTRGYHRGSPAFANLCEEGPVNRFEARKKMALEDFGELLQKSDEDTGLRMRRRRLGGDSARDGGGGCCSPA